VSSPRLVQRALAGLVAALFVVGLVASTLVGEPERPASSVASSEPDGRRALFLFLGELGFASEAWRAAPVSLPAGANTLWIPRRPRLPGSAERDAELGADEAAAREPEPEEPGQQAILADPRHPSNYGRFLRSGGTLIMTGSAENHAWLRESCGLDLPAWTACGLSGASERLELDSGEELSLALEPEFPPLAEAAAEPLERAPWDPDELEAEGWHHLAVGADGRPFASWISLEEGGRLLLLAQDRFLDNELLGSGDNGLLALRLAEGLVVGRLLFDEFALGAWVPPSQGQLLLGPGLFEVAYHGLLFCLLFTLFHAWRREFPRDPRPAALDPRARVASQARLFERAKRYDLLAHELRLGGLRRVARRLGLPREQSRLRERTSPETLAELARSWGRRSGQLPRAAAWAAAFEPAPIGSLDELEALGRELDSLEKSIASSPQQADTGAARRS
jgi:hypothetical protein